MLQQERPQPLVDAVLHQRGLKVPDLLQQRGKLVIRRHAAAVPPEHEPDAREGRERPAVRVDWRSTPSSVSDDPH
jgi:hypothetical protein